MMKQERYKLSKSPPYWVAENDSDVYVKHIGILLEDTLKEFPTKKIGSTIEGLYEKLEEPYNENVENGSEVIEYIVIFEPKNFTPYRKAYKKLLQI